MNGVVGLVPVVMRVDVVVAVIVLAGAGLVADNLAMLL